MVARAMVRQGRRTEAIEYARRINVAVNRATKARHELMAHLGVLVHRGELALPRIGLLGMRYALAFEEVRCHVREAPPPHGAEDCADALVRWLDGYIAACDALGRAATSRDTREVAAALDMMRRGEVHARRFNAARRFLAERLAA